MDKEKKMKLKNKKGRRKSFEGTACRPASLTHSPGLCSKPALITSKGCCARRLEDKSLMSSQTLVQATGQRDAMVSGTGWSSISLHFDFDRALSSSVDQNPMFSGA